MKKVIIGCCLTLVGAFSNVALFIATSFQVNELSEWTSPPGKFITAMAETGLVFPIIISTILFVLGLYFLFEEYLVKKN